MSPLGRAALDYAARGWPVFPLRPRDKRPLTEHGLHDATTDTSLIVQWWRATPDANVGLRTGVAFDVLDVDDDAGLAALAEHGPLDGGPEYLNGFDGPESLTSKGFHRFLLPTGAGNRTRFVANCDWRGVGGYVVAPPSIHPSSHVYLWGVGGPDVPLEPCPRWLLDLVKPAGPSVLGPSTGDRGRGDGASTMGLVGAVAAAPEGQRNSTLFWAASRAIDHYRSGRLSKMIGEQALASILGRGLLR